MVIKKYELLAPAGNFSMLVAAVNAGADAVYFGLQKYGMRANANNFEIKDLDKIREIL
jgi:putative protease